MTISKARWSFVACAWYLTFFCSEVCIFPFVNVYMSSQGLTQQQIGIIGALRPWLGVPASFLGSLLADYLQVHRVMMVALMLSFNAVRLLLPAASSFGTILAIVLVTECLASPVTIMADAAVTSNCSEEGEYGRYRLWGAIGWGGMSTVAGALIDAYGWPAAYACNLFFLLPCLFLTWLLWKPKSKEDNLQKVSPGEYHEARHKAAAESSKAHVELRSLGISDKLGLGSDHEEQSWATTTHRKAAPAVPAPTLPGPPSAEASEHEADERELPFAEKLARIFKSGESLVFFWTAICMGFGFGMIEGYLFLLLKDLGATDMLLGLTLTVTCASEAPMFHFQGMMLRKLGSPDVLLDICLAAYIVRMLAYAVLPSLTSPWWVLLVEPLHGLTFACGWGAGCEKSKALAPPGLEATQQGIFQGLYFGLGYGLGTLTGGLIAQRWNFQAMYVIGASIVAAGWMAALSGRWLVSQQRTLGAKYAAVAAQE